MPCPHHDHQRPTTFSRENPRVDVIFNSVSGTRDPDEDLSIIRNTLEQSFDEVVVWQTTPEKGGEELGDEALAAGARVLVACGGDGTVAGVASAMKKKETSKQAKPPILGVVPRGTANALCAALDIPTEVDRAAAMVASGSLRRLDFPRIVPPADGIASSMLLLCGIGLEAETVSRADRRMKRTIGTAAYAVAGLASTLQQRSFTTDLVLHDVEDSLMFADGNVESKEMRLKGLKLMGVTIANAAPATSVLAQGIGQVKPDDGLLEVVCIADDSPIGIARLMISMLKSALMRTREQRGNVYGLRARKVEIICDPPQMIVIDGEDAGLTPITVELNADVDHVQVIAPKAGIVNRRRRRFSRYLTRLWRNVRGLGIFALTVSIMRAVRRKQIAS